MAGAVVIAAGRYVVVGATGILAPLGAVLRGCDRWAVGISRGVRLGSGSWDDRVALDTQDARAVEKWVIGQGERANTLVAYEPAVAVACWPLLASVADRCVVIATTEWLDVAHWDAPWCGTDASVVQLGWVRTGYETRWHTPDEVSAAVMRVLAAAPVQTVVLGETGPWWARPDG